MELFATLDSIIEDSYEEGALKKYHAYREYQKKSDILSEKLIGDLHSKYELHKATIRSWFPERAAVPYAVQFTDWALENQFLEPIHHHCSTKLGITSSAPRFPLLENITYLVWACGTIAESTYSVNITGPKDSLLEICEDINFQTSWNISPKKQRGVNAYSIDFKPYTTKLGRLIAPLIGFTGSKIDRVLEIPYLAKRTDASKRRFLQTLNSAKGRLTIETRTKRPRKGFTISLPAQRLEKDAKRLVLEIAGLAKDVTDMDLNYNVYEREENGKISYRSRIYTSVDEAAEYLSKCNLKL